MRSIYFFPSVLTSLMFIIHQEVEMLRIRKAFTTAINIPNVAILILLFNLVLYLYYEKTLRNEDTITRPANIYCFGCTIKNIEIIMGENICDRVGHSEIDLLILIFTTHKNQEARNAIRETWLSVSNGKKGNIRHAFLLGRSENKALESFVHEENRVFKDIVQGDFVDSYYNLTTKTMLGLKWFLTKCSYARYILKTDDDVYVNIPGLQNLIKSHSYQLETSMAGTCFRNITPVRNEKSKWYVSEKEYPKNAYPDYCSGTGYLLSANVARQIAAVSATVPFFYFEDVYMGLCVEKLGFKVISLPGFHSSTYRPLDCMYKTKYLVTSHRIEPKLQRKIWYMPCGITYSFHYLM